MYGINNCETTIRKLLNSKESIEDMENYVKMRKSKGLHGLFARSKKVTMIKAGNKKEGGAKKLSTNEVPKDTKSKNKCDRLIRDKRFLAKLTRIETLVPSKRQVFYSFIC